MYGFQEKCKNVVMRIQSPLVYVVDTPRGEQRTLSSWLETR